MRIHITQTLGAASEYQGMCAAACMCVSCMELRAYTQKAQTEPRGVLEC